MTLIPNSDLLLLSSFGALGLSAVILVFVVAIYARVRRVTHAADLPISASTRRVKAGWTEDAKSKLTPFGDEMLRGTDITGDPLQTVIHGEKTYMVYRRNPLFGNGLVYVDDGEIEERLKHAPSVKI
jgi:hypothetical protein